MSKVMLELIPLIFWRVKRIVFTMTSVASSLLNNKSGFLSDVTIGNPRKFFEQGLLLLFGSSVSSSIG